MDLLTHYLHVLLLGVIEGVTEFLPISSRAHLLVAERLGLGPESAAFNAMIQGGALLALFLVYGSKISSLLTHLENRAARGYLLKVLSAFLITCVLGLIVVNHFRIQLSATLFHIAAVMLAGGVIIFLVELLSGNLYLHDDVSWEEAVCMGLAQVLAAIFPGASRFGASVMTGLALGMKRPSATEFSFLIVIPTLLASWLLDLWYDRADFVRGGRQLWLDGALGFVVSAIVAFFTVIWLLRFLRSHTFNGFGVYRVIFGIVLFVALSINLLPSEGAVKSPVKVPSPVPVRKVSTPVPAVLPPTHAAPVNPAIKAMPLPDIGPERNVENEPINQGTISPALTVAAL